jgi:RNase H-fold protein (predicted Holliday junction resolvase)
VNSALQKIIQKEGIEKIVVGVPQYNTETPLYKQIQEFIKLLKQNTGTPVETEDELLTSEAGRKKMSLANGAGDTHTLAAQVILESYLKAY